jgi:RHS repeat-associated protein
VKIKTLFNIVLNLKQQMKKQLILLLILPYFLIAQVKKGAISPNTKSKIPTNQNSRFATTNGTSNQLSGNQFEHDASGNITKDLTQGISNIIYDTYLSKPKEIIFIDGRKLNIYYDGAGTKLKTVLTKNNALIVQYEYAGNFTYIKKQGDTESKLLEINLPEIGGRAIPDPNDPTKFTYEFDIEDHTGSPRVTFRANSSNQLEVVRSQDYDPFGVVLEGIDYKAPSDTLHRKYFFNGKEYMITVGLKMYDYGARQYNPRLGRFYQVDPKADLMPNISPYVFSFNNPLRYRDYDGQIPYPITIRSFAPASSFGLGFHGDNRGYSTNSDVSARVHQKLNFDTDKNYLTGSSWSSPTWHTAMPSYQKTATTNFDISAFSAESADDSRKFNISTHNAGANPLISGSPPIDVFSSISITEKNGLLSISTKLTGDNFPSTEAFITDPSGKSAFIGIGFYKGGPFSSLSGENKDRAIGTMNMSISTDKKGNFTGVSYGSKNYSLGDWNKLFENADPYKNDKK